MNPKPNKPNGRAAKSSRGKQQDKANWSLDTRVFLVLSRNSSIISASFLRAQTPQEAANSALANLSPHEECLLSLPLTARLIKQASSFSQIWGKEVNIWGFSPFNGR